MPTYDSETDTTSNEEIPYAAEVINMVELLAYEEAEDEEEEEEEESAAGTLAAWGAVVGAVFMYAH